MNSLREFRLNLAGFLKSFRSWTVLDKHIFRDQPRGTPLLFIILHSKTDLSLSVTWNDFEYLKKSWLGTWFVFSVIGSSFPLWCSVETLSSNKAAQSSLKSAVTVCPCNCPGCLPQLQLSHLNDLSYQVCHPSLTRRGRLYYPIVTRRDFTVLCFFAALSWGVKNRNCSRMCFKSVIYVRAGTDNHSSKFA